MNKLKKVLAVMLCLNILFPVSPLYLFASGSDISGVTPVDNVYTIEPESVSDNTGFRYYENFTLSDSDTANLVFGSDYSKFVNLVYNQVNLNGLMNTVDGSGLFYNGHAIFVSPNGIVVGSSGVINVGSLSLVSTTEGAFNKYNKTHSSQNYDNLISNASGNVVIGGKILSQGTVEAYGQNVRLESGGITTESTGQVVSDSAAAEALFSSIVSNSSNSANSFTVEDGKVILSSKDGITTVNDSTIQSATVDVNGYSTILNTAYQDHIPTEEERELFFETASAEVAVEDSEISANNLTVSAIGKYKGQAHTSMLPSVVWDSLLELIDLEDEREEYIDKMFSSNTFEGFDGARSSAVVNISNSTLKSSDALSVTTKSTSSMKVTEPSVAAIADFIYTIGAETESKINVDNSTLSSSGTTDVLASSDNTLKASFARADGLFKVDDQEGYNFSFVNASNIADTAVTINNSTVTGGETTVQSLASESSSIKTTHAATVGEGTFSVGSTAAVISIVLNNSDVNSEVNITEGSTVSSTESDLSVTAVDLGTNESSIKTSTAKETARDKSDIAAYTSANFIFDKIVPDDYEQKGNLLLLFKDIFNKGIERFNAELPDYEGNFKMGGSFAFTNAEANVVNNIENSTLTSAGDLNLTAYRYDDYANTSSTKAAKGDTTVAAGLALIVNTRNNNTDLNITDSTTDSTGKTEMRAITQIPSRTGNVNVQFGSLFEFRLKFNEGIGSVTDITPEWELKMPTYIQGQITLGFSGLYNNTAVSTTKSEKLSFGASALFDTVSNSTDILVAGSTINSKKSINTVAFNSFNLLDSCGLDPNNRTEYKDLPSIWDTDATGASLLVQNFTNDATVNINSDSAIEASGKVTVGSANNEFYTSIAKIGVESSVVGVGASAVSQTVSGTTGTYIDDNSTVKGSSVSVDAGKVTTGLFDKIDDNNKFQFTDDNTAKDQSVFVDITGSLMRADTSETVVDVGAAIILRDIARNVEARVLSSKLTSTTGSISVNSSTEQTSFGAAFAASYFKNSDDESKSGAAAANGAVNAQNAVNNAANNAANNNVVGNNLPAGGNAGNAANNAADPDKRVSFSLAATGSLAVLHDTSTVGTYVTDSVLTSVDKINLTSSQDNFTFFITGSLAETVTIGAGAAANFYKREGSVKTVTDSSVLQALTINSDATDETKIINTSAGVGITDSSKSGYGLAVGGSFAFNTIAPEVSSIIQNSELKGISSDEQASLSVTANSPSKILSISGAMTAEDVDGLAFSASIAASAEHLNTSLTALIKNSTLTSNIKDVLVKASDKMSMRDISVSLSATDSGSSTSGSFDGSLGVVYSEEDIIASIEESDIEVSGDIDVTAENNTSAFNLAGTAEISTAQSGLGINGAVVINVQENNVDASITSADESNKIKAAGNINLYSGSYEYLNNIPVSFAIAKDSSMASSSVAISILNNTVNSASSGVFRTGKNFSQNSLDETYFLTWGGTLAATGEGTAVLDAAVNYDRSIKTVTAVSENAKIYAEDGNVTVNASSIDAIGGTKNSDGEYERDGKEEIVNETEEEHGKDTSLNVDKINSDITKWNMFFNLAAGINSKLSFSGNAIIKDISNTVSAKMTDSGVLSQNMDVTASDVSVKNVFAGSIDASLSQAAAVAGGIQVMYVTDESSVSSLVSGSTLNVSGNVNLDALVQKDSKSVLVAGAGSSSAGATANVLSDNSSSAVSASLESSTVKNGTLSVNASEDFEATKIMVGGAGAKNAAVVVNPVINDYSETINASISDSNITETAKNVSVTADTDTDIDNFVLGLGFALQGAALTGVGVGNTYSTGNHAIIENSTLSNSSDTVIKGVNDLTVKNVLIAGAVVNQGASGVGNVTVNDIQTETEAALTGSTVSSAGNLSLITNLSDDGSSVDDKVKNTSISLGAAVQGATVDANLVFNFFHGSANGQISDSEITDASAINVNSYTGRDINTLSLLASGSAQGVAGNLNLIKDRVDSSTTATVNAGDKTISTTGDLNLSAKDSSLVKNTAGNMALTAEGAGIGVNIVLYSGNAAAKSSLLSTSEGKISAANINSDSSVDFGYEQDSAGILTGAGTIFTDVSRIKLGNDTEYTYLEDIAGINTAVEMAEESVAESFGTLPDEPTSDIGSISELNAVVEASGELALNSNTTVKGYDSDELELNNYTGTFSGLGVGAAAKSLKAYSNTASLISGGSVKADIVSLYSNYKDNIAVEVVEAGAEGISAAGGSSTYKSGAVTQSVISGGEIEASSDVNVESVVNTKSSSKVTDVKMKGLEMEGAGYESVSEATSEALITGSSTSVKANNVNVHSDSSIDLYAENLVVSLENVGIKFLTNEVNADSQTLALISDGACVEAEDLNLTSSYSNMTVGSKSNVVRIVGFDISGSKAETGFGSVFKSGLSSAGTVTVSGTTTINTAAKNSEDTENMSSEAVLNSTDISVGSGYGGLDAVAISTASSETIVDATSFETENLAVNAYLDSDVTAKSADVSVSLGGIKNVDSKAQSNSTLTVTISGSTTVNGSADIYTSHNATTDANMKTFTADIFGDVDVVDIVSEMTSNTEVNFGGTFNANEINLKAETNRYAKLDLSKNEGGFININSSEASSTVTGGSVINVNSVTTDADKTGDFLISNILNTTGDFVSHSGDGGFISVNVEDFDYDFNTASSINISDSAINASGAFTAQTNTTNTVKDSSSSGGGGFVEVHSSWADNTYQADSSINISNTTISANEIDVAGKTTIQTDADDYIKHVSDGGGFVDSRGVHIDNELIQNNTISLTGSTLTASDTVQIASGSNFSFKQMADADTGGFTTWPEAEANLTSKNNNTLTLDSSSSVSAGTELLVEFGADGTLYTYAEANANDVSSQPESNSELVLNINNTLTNEGTLSAGDYLKINYLGNSNVDLHQESYSVHEATAPFTSEDGELVKTVTNALNLPLNATLSTGRYMDILMEKGSESIFSDVHYKCIYEAIVINVKTKKGHDTDNITNTLTNSFVMDGDVVAGDESGTRMLVINRDGTVNTEESFGFNESDYEVFEGDPDVTGETLKEEKLAEIDAELETVDESISRQEELIEDYTGAREDFFAALETYAEITENYEIVTIEELTSEYSSDFKNAVVSSMGGAGTEEQYDAILSGYQDTDLTFDEYLSQNYPEWTDAFESARSSVGEMGVLSIYGSEECYMEMFSYNNKAAATEEQLSKFSSSLSSMAESFTSKLTAAQAEKSSLEETRTTIAAEREEAELKSAEEYGILYQPYAYIFKDMDLHDGNRVNITGLTADEIEHPNVDALQFKISRSSGVEIENYSKYSLSFSDLVMTDVDEDLSYTPTSGPALEIGGEDRTDLIVSETPTIVGVTINSYSDETNPFNYNETGYDETHLGNIVFNDRLITNGYNVNIFTQSGDLYINSLYEDSERTATFSAPQGSVFLSGAEVDGTNTLVLTENESVTAGEDIIIAADTVDIKGDLTAGVRERTLVLDFSTFPLIEDPSTGNVDLIQMVGGNNIGAIYRNDTVYVFSIGPNNGRLLLRGLSDSITGSITGTVTVNHGFNDVNIDSEMGSVKNVVVSDIVNTSDTSEDIEVINTGDVTMSYAKVYVNGVEQGDITGTPVVMNSTNDPDAEVEVTGIHTVMFNGKIMNGIYTDVDGNPLTDSEGEYIKESSAFLNINGPKSVIVNHGIDAGGAVYFYTTDQANLIINGYVNADQILFENENESGTDFIKNIKTDNAIFTTTTETMTALNVKIKNYAEFETASKKVVVDNRDSSKKDDVSIKLYTGGDSLTLVMDEGDVIITDAPVIYNTGTHLIKNKLGFHTMETLAMSEANEIETFAFKITTQPIVPELIVEEDSEMIEDQSIVAE